MHVVLRGREDMNMVIHLAPFGVFDLLILTTLK